MTDGAPGSGATWLSPAHSLPVAGAAGPKAPSLELPSIVARMGRERWALSPPLHIKQTLSSLDWAGSKVASPSTSS